MPAGLLRHLWRGLRHALGTVLGWASVAFLAAGIVVEAVAYFASGPSALLAMTTHMAALALAIAVGYGVGFTVLVGETVGLLARGAGDLERMGVSEIERLERIKQPQ